MACMNALVHFLQQIYQYVKIGPYGPKLIWHLG